MTAIRIPFNKVALVGREMEYMVQAMNAGHISGDGSFTKRCHAELSRLTGGGRVLLTTSCTHALEMMALLLELKPGDEVILPSFTFVSTVNAFVLRGVTPVFVDIRRDTLNIDEKLVAGAITARTKAIVVVHYAGVACAMEEILRIGREHGVPVLEDNAHGLFGSYRERALGSFGAMAAQSFHETKNLTCGEGGALVINDVRFAERAEIIREKGTNRSQFFRGMVDKYGWVDIGSSYLPSDLLAAFLLARIEEAESTQARRGAVWNRYHAELAEWSNLHGVGRPVVPPECRQPYHMYYLIMPSLASRQGLIAHLKSLGILATFHYLPLHLSPVGQRFGGKAGDCPVTEDVSDRLVRLPLFDSLTDTEVTDVLRGVLNFGWPV